MIAVGLGISYYRQGGDPLTAAVKALFASGEKGVMLDFSRASNLFTDSARTTPVVANGDRIGSVTDLSPNGKHASSSSTARPTWSDAGYGTFDALDDYLQTAAIDFSGTDKITVVASVRKLSDASAGLLVELTSNSGTQAGSFGIRAPVTASDNFGIGMRGAAEARYTLAGYAAPTTRVITSVYSQTGVSISDNINVRIDGAAPTTSVAAAGPAAGTAFANSALNIGARNNGSSLFFNGRIYRLLVIGRALTTTERTAAEKWAAQPAGVIL